MREAPGLCRASWLGALLLLAASGLLAACGADGRFVIIGTARAPSASGIVEVDEIDGGSTFVTIHLEHLHPPERLAQGYTTYVVWFEGPVGAPVKAGVLQYDPSARTGDLAETSSSRDFVVKVTVERDENATQPSEIVVASQQVSTD
jgi:hypothetical protein